MSCVSRGFAVVVQAKAGTRQHGAVEEPELVSEQLTLSTANCSSTMRLM